MIKIIAALLFACALTPPVQAADYWLCLDAQGRKTAQDRPCADQPLQASPRKTPAVSTPSAEPTPLLPALPSLDMAALKPQLRQGFLIVLALVALLLLYRGLRRVLQAWAEREPRPRKPSAPERIEPSEALRRHSQE